MHVLFEDNHVLAVVKPVGLPTMGAAEDEPSLVTLAKAYLKQKYQKPGNVYLGVVSRVDAAVSGVVVLARTSKAAARLSEQFRERDVEKTYWALVEGRIEPPQATLTDWLAKDERQQRMQVVGPRHPGAQQATLGYRRLSDFGVRSLVEVQLETGRKHQIRVQLAERGHPVVGDRKYGGQQAFPAGIALHARRLVFRHPISKVPIDLQAPLPMAWRQLGISEATVTTP